MRTKTAKQGSSARGAEKAELMISCPAFGALHPIPQQYTCEGANINPQLDIRFLPSTTRSLAVIVSDENSYVPCWIHWVIWNIPATKHILEAHVPGVQGINDFHESHYGGPCPPEGTGVHHYHYRVYALDSLLDLPPATNAHQLESAMKGHVLAWGELVGTYRHP